MVYADDGVVTTLTNEISNAMNDEDDFNALLTRAIQYSDRKINNKLADEDLTTFTEGDTNIPEDLQEAGNLYAAALIFNTYYSSNDRSSPAASSHRNDADDFVKAYIKSQQNSISPLSKFSVVYDKDHD